MKGVYRKVHSFLCVIDLFQKMSILSSKIKGINFKIKGILKLACTRKF